MQALGPNQEKWLAALESGNYKQGKGKLHAVDSSGHSFCCLGVACEVVGVEGKLLKVANHYTYDGFSAIVPVSVEEALSLKSSTGTLEGGGVSLTSMNDHGASFADIAKMIRANPALVFTEPR